MRREERQAAVRGYKGKNGGTDTSAAALLKRQRGTKDGRGMGAAVQQLQTGQGFAGRHWLAQVGTGWHWEALVGAVHARRCWFRWAGWLVGEQSVAPVTADGRHTNHCFESTAQLLRAALHCSAPLCAALRRSPPVLSAPSTPGPSERQTLQCYTPRAAAARPPAPAARVTLP
ncbi:uncharacterized protein EKO05_0008614 [Ascochyta rabiei]|uniref:uncharacterized protein n=1 Tax=Didymella rabiei TaxID=5454 RepID=UPI00190078BF|nr:uncharacterized protein EKO05_0008614 [Ascochyta rabiei]UPX18311.1 hypothetical protein EKO05_0008614 [Ascochyta rabiei]